jgi:hypothetical protein
MVENYLIPNWLAAIHLPPLKKVLAENPAKEHTKRKKLLMNKAADALKGLELKIGLKQVLEINFWICNCFDLVMPSC